jgi:hypothetical protein
MLLSTGKRGDVEGRDGMESFNITQSAMSIATWRGRIQAEELK